MKLDCSPSTRRDHASPGFDRNDLDHHAPALHAAPPIVAGITSQVSAAREPVAPPTGNRYALVEVCTGAAIALVFYFVLAQPIWPPGHDRAPGVSTSLVSNRE